MAERFTAYVYEGNYTGEDSFLHLYKEFDNHHQGYLGQVLVKTVETTTPIEQVPFRLSKGDIVYVNDVGWCEVLEYASHTIILK